MIDEKKLIKEIQARHDFWTNKSVKCIEDGNTFKADMCNIMVAELNMILHMIDEQPKADEWIPCSERLPDEGKEVLISYDYDSFDIEMTPKRYLGVMIGCYEDSEWWSSGKWTDGVTAWYPLPDPWEGDSK